MPIFIALALLLLNNFVLFSASAASSELAEDPSQVPVPVYRISGTTSTGLVVNGVVVFSCHSTPSHCYMQQIGEFVHQATHFIVESDPYFVEGFHTTSHTTKYHEDSEFIRLGIYCEHDNTGSLLEHFKETDSPCKVLLEQYPRKNTLYTTFNRLWRNILGGFSYDNGIDTWAYESGKKHTLFCLEDMCDQAQSEEEELQMDHEMFKVLNFEQWKDLLIKTYDFIESPGYLYYKIIISNFVKGQGDKPFEFPGLVQSIEGEFFCRWTTQLCFDEDFNYCGRCRLQIETDDSLIYRNRLWLERLRDRILPSINGEPFILVVGASHALVRAESKEKLGVLDFFEDLVGPENVRLLNRPA